MTSLQSIRVTFDASVYSLIAIKKASYTIAATASVEIARVGPDWVCELRFLKSTSEEACRDCVESFRIEVLDQDLREHISAETSSVRNVILALAFSRTDLQSDE